LPQKQPDNWFITARPTQICVWIWENTALWFQGSVLRGGIVVLKHIDRGVSGSVMSWMASSSEGATPVSESPEQPEITFQIDAPKLADIPAGERILSRFKPGWRAFADVLFLPEPRSRLERWSLAILLYVAAVVAREALLFFEPVRDLTYFPALLASCFLCGL